MVSRQLVVKTSIAGASFAGLTYAIDQQTGCRISRSGRVFSTFASIGLDFKLLQWNTLHSSPEYKEKLNQVHRRTAQKILLLCLNNAGAYTKFGQQLASLNHALPLEYTQTLSVLQDKAIPVSFEDIRQCLENELHGPIHHFFKEFNPHPIASASLAQVHRATTLNGDDVAVKIQYPNVYDHMWSDLKTLFFVLKVSKMVFPDFSLEWVLPEFQASLTSELDFRQEKKNAEKISQIFAENDQVHVPKMYDKLCSTKVITMEFIEGCKINDVKGIKNLGLDPSKISNLLFQMFGEMIFCQGFVHCDPHPGNIFVRKCPSKTNFSVEQLVLLDHGLYRQLDKDFRKAHCNLWKAMLLRDNALLKECGNQLRAGEFYRFFPLIFTYRSMESSSRTAGQMTPQEREELRTQLRSISLGQVNDFMRGLPRDMLFVFRIMNLTRSLNKDLGGTSGKRFSIMAKYAVKGLTINDQEDEKQQTLYQQFRKSIVYTWEYNSLNFRIKLIDLIVSWKDWWYQIDRLPDKHIG